MLSEEQERVKAYFKLFSILTDRDIERFIQLSVKRKLKKSDFFIREGQICKEVAFVLKGTHYLGGRKRAEELKDRFENKNKCLLNLE